MGENANGFPSTLKAAVYANDPAPQFPEQSDDRFNPAKAGIGIALSGGGPRAFSCAHGQMAYYALNGGLDAVGAISCVSGGAWFGGLFSYANASTSDSDLFGTVTVTAPGDITLDMISADIDDQCLLSTIPGVSNEAIIGVFATLLVIHKLDPKDLPWDRFYNRLVDTFFCGPFGLNSLDTTYTIDGVIGAAGTSLGDISTYKLRQGRPFYIANATQLWPTGANEVMRRFEFSSLYSGMPQAFPGAGNGGQDLGYGYVENFAFNSAAPAAPPSAGIVTVDTPTLVPLLSDAMGSSSAAFASILAKLSPEISESINPEYSYWPMTSIGTEAAQTYQIGDGGNLENTGIAGLLMRGYQLIIAFVNSEYPLGSTDGGCVNGVAGQISRLFGYIPESHFGNSQDTQIFAGAEFGSKLVPGLEAAKQAGGIVYTMGNYTIIDDNAFGIDPALYPDGAFVCWVYNDIISSWVNDLPTDVSDLLSSTDKTNYFANFPNFATVGQNKTKHGIPELIYYTPEQTNLLANMWFNALNSDEEFQNGIAAKRAELGI